MLLSCKITKTILTYLENQGVDLEAIYETSEVPREFLTDSSYWLRADEMERLLHFVDLQMATHSTEDFVQNSGHAVSQLRTWGALDSVLRMVSDPKDSLTQPQNFLSYFIDPKPPVAKVLKTEEGMSFEIPIERDQYPLCNRFLLSAIEALPTFLGKDPFKAKWTSNMIEIQWSSQQESMLSVEEQETRSIRPELFQNVLKDLEDNQKKLEQFQKEILVKDKEIENLILENQRLRNNTHPQDEVNDHVELSNIDSKCIMPLQKSLSEMYRMNDYLSRSFQLVTLLVGQGRADRQVKEAMRRVDWERIQKEYPEVFRLAATQLSDMKSHFEELKDKQAKRQESSVEESRLSELLDQAIDTVETNNLKGIKIDRHFVFDHQIKVDRGHFRQALVYILSSALDDVDEQKGALRIVTRPKGSRAEIEISDTGKGYQREQLDEILKSSKINHPFRKAQSLLQKNDSHLSISSEVGRGSTFTVDLPIHSIHN